MSLDPLAIRAFLRDLQSQICQGLEAADGASETKKTKRMLAGLRVIVQHWADYLAGAAARDEKHRI